MILEGLDDSVPDPCLWNSERVLGRLNRRGVGDGEFRHGLGLLLELGRALDKFAMAHVGWCGVGLNRRMLLLFKPCLSNFDTLYGNRTHATSLDPWIKEAFYH